MTRLGVALAALVAALGLPGLQPADATLDLAAAYARRFEQAFAAIRWHERYEQDVRVEQVFGSSGARTNRRVDSRVLEAEMMLVWLPDDRTWLAVRDVVRIDGRTRPTAERRLPALEAAAPIPLPALRELARENGLEVRVVTLDETRFPVIDDSPGLAALLYHVDPTTIPRP